MKSKGYFGMMATQSATTGGRCQLERRRFSIESCFRRCVVPTVNKFVGISSKAAGTMRSGGDSFGTKNSQRESRTQCIVESLMRTNERETQNHYR